MEKAVAYIRVSTKSDSQLHSYEYQLEYWKNKIESEDNKILVSVYQDYGISGRSIHKRPQLLKLLEDAKKHEFSIVYTKSVSRFARNTTELLEMVRTLREENVKVIFEKENIDTFDPSAELYLTIAASVAENDLKIYSENQRWSYKERFKKGYIWANKMLGYRMNNETNTLEVVEDEAKIVKKIFELYISGYGITKICKILQSENLINTKGTMTWSKSAIRYIISNEKYKGCSLNQKSVYVNGIKQLNKGYEKQYYIEDSHKAIISKEVFDKVQKIIYERASKNQLGRGIIPPYPFTGKIYCGICGHKYHHRFNNTNKSWRVAIWSCKNKQDNGKIVCASTDIKETVLKEKFIEAYNEFITTNRFTSEEQVLQDKVKILIEEETELKKLKINRMIENIDYDKEIKEIHQEIEEINNALLKYSLKNITKKDLQTISIFDEDKVDKFINKVIITRYKVKFIFINGIEIEKEYSNGQSGNKKGWNLNKQRKEQN